LSNYAGVHHDQPDVSLALENLDKHLGLGFGVDPGYFSRPCALAIYDHPLHGELIVVCEWGGNRVQVITADGGVLAVFEEIKKPYHVVVDAGGALYVTEFVTREIKRLTLGNQKKRKARE
jgi:hypothetical protein